MQPRERRGEIRGATLRHCMSAGSTPAKDCFLAMCSLQQPDKVVKSNNLACSIHTYGELLAADGPHFFHVRQLSLGGVLESDTSQCRAVSAPWIKQVSRNAWQWIISSLSVRSIGELQVLSCNAIQTAASIFPGRLFSPRHWCSLCRICLSISCRLDAELDLRAQAVAWGLQHKVLVVTPYTTTTL